MDRRTIVRHIAKDAVRCYKTGNITAAMDMIRIAARVAKGNSVKQAVDQTFAVKRAEATPQPMPGTSGMPGAPFSQPHWIPKPEPKPNVELLELAIKQHDPELHDKLYANRGAEFWGLTAATSAPVARSILGGKINFLDSALARTAAGGLGVGSRLYGNNSDVVSQNALRTLLLKNENNAKKINEIIARTVGRQAAVNTPGIIRKAWGWNPEVTAEESYNANAAHRYTKALLDVQKNNPNALMPELDSLFGQGASAILAATPSLPYNPLKWYPSAASMGLNVARSAATGHTLNQRLNELHQDKIGPNTPNVFDFFGNGLTAHTDANFIGSIPAREQATYLRNKDINNNIVARIQRQGSNEQPNNLIPTGDHRKGDPIFKVPDNWITRRNGVAGKLIDITNPTSPQLEFLRHFSDEAKKRYSKTLSSITTTLTPKQTDSEKYDYNKTRLRQPSGANK
jgi:hypothetical protein